MELEETVDSCNVKILIKVALKSPEASQWYNVMMDELKIYFRFIDRQTLQECIERTYK